MTHQTPTPVCPHCGYAMDYDDMLIPDANLFDAAPSFKISLSILTAERDAAVARVSVLNGSLEVEKRWRKDSDERAENLQVERDAALARAAQAEATDETGAMWRANLHNFLDVAAGEGLVLGGVDAADLYMAVFPDEYKAASDPLPAPPLEQIKDWIAT